jgi:hypothetical protein
VQDRIVAGDTLNFPTEVPGFLASDGWSLHYRLIQRLTGYPVEITAVADGDNYLVNVAALSTASWTTGDYSWASWVTRGTERYSLSTGTCTVIPDPATAVAGTDLRTPARKALDDAKTAYYSWTPTQRSYRIGDREMVFNSAADIITHIDRLQSIVTIEERTADMAKGYPDKRKVYVRVSNA